MNPTIENIISLNFFFPIIRSIVVVLVLLVVHRMVMKTVRNNLLKRAKNKKQKSSITIIIKILNYLFLFALILFIITTYSGSFTGLGLGIGLFSAALGWALQSPITGFAAWIMIIIKRPFDIGDRIIIGDNKKGDVADITPTHIYLEEVGGTIPDSEDRSGRIIMIPNSLLFTESIINYTQQNDYVLAQVILSIPYENNLKKAIKIALNATNKFTKEYQEKTKSKPYIRLTFESSSVDIKVRYQVLATKIQATATKIREEIFEKVSKEKDVEIAYPHTEVIFRRKNEN